MSMLTTGLRAVGTVVDDAARFVASYFGSNPGVVASVGKRLGLGAMATPSAVIRSMKESPVTTALVLFELGEAGADLLSQLAGVSEEAKKVVEGLTFNADQPPSDEVSLEQLTAYKDELQMIKDVQRKLGFSIGDLIMLKNTLSLDMRFFKLYLQVKEMDI